MTQPPRSRGCFPVPRYIQSRGMKREGEISSCTADVTIGGSRDVYLWSLPFVSVMSDRLHMGHIAHSSLSTSRTFPKATPSYSRLYRERAQPHTTTTTSAPSLAKHARRTCSDRSCRPDRRDNSAQPQLLLPTRNCESHEPPPPPRSSSTRASLDLQSEHSSRTS
jgi:hypothetical protein